MKPQTSWRNGRPYSLSLNFTHSSDAGMMFEVSALILVSRSSIGTMTPSAAKPGIIWLLQAMTMSGGAPPATEAAISSTLMLPLMPRTWMPGSPHSSPG